MADDFAMRAKKYRDEARDVASGAGPVVLKPDEQAELRAARMREAAKTAPTTKTTMGRMYQKGGYVRSADGIASKGKTRGRIC